MYSVLGLMGHCGSSALLAESVRAVDPWWLMGSRDFILISFGPLYNHVSLLKPYVDTDIIVMSTEFTMHSVL